MTSVKCPGCKRAVARRTVTRRHGERLTPLNGAVVEAHPGVAPRIKCVRCGTLTVLVKGSL